MSLVSRDWEREITRANAAAAEGQLAEQLTDPEEPSWARAMTSYRDKNGAAYARDAVMAARLATDDPAALRGPAAPPGRHDRRHAADTGHPG